eukprot:g44758.t1
MGSRAGPGDGGSGPEIESLSWRLQKLTGKAKVLGEGEHKVVPLAKVHGILLEPGILSIVSWLVVSARGRQDQEEGRGGVN